MTADITLAPCPFCGAEPKTLERPDNIDGTEFVYAVYCHCDGYAATVHQMARRKTHEQAKRDCIAAWNRRAQAPAPQGSALVPLTDEQIFRAAASTLPGKAHALIHVTDPDYAAMCGLEPGTRWTCCEVRPEHSLDFARAIQIALGITSPDKAKPTPCRPHPIYRGPSNCNYGTVGCLEPGHRDRPRPTGASHEQPT